VPVLEGVLQIRNRNQIVILSEAKDLLFAGARDSRSFAPLRMTTYILFMSFTEYDTR